MPSMFSPENWNSATWKNHITSCGNSLFFSGEVCASTPGGQPFTVLTLHYPVGLLSCLLLVPSNHMSSRSELLVAYNSLKLFTDFQLEVKSLILIPVISFLVGSVFSKLSWTIFFPKVKLAGLKDLADKLWTSLQMSDKSFKPTMVKFPNDHIIIISNKVIYVCISTYI